METDQDHAAEQVDRAQDPVENPSTEQVSVPMKEASAEPSKPLLSRRKPRRSSVGMGRSSSLRGLTGSSDHSRRLDCMQKSHSLRNIPSKDLTKPRPVDEDVEDLSDDGHLQPQSQDPMERPSATKGSSDAKKEASSEPPKPLLPRRKPRRRNSMLNTSLVTKDALQRSNSDPALKSSPSDLPSSLLGSMEGSADPTKGLLLKPSARDTLTQSDMRRLQSLDESAHRTNDDLKNYFQRSSSESAIQVVKSDNNDNNNHSVSMRGGGRRDRSGCRAPRKNRAKREAL